MPGSARTASSCRELQERRSVIFGKEVGGRRREQRGRRMATRRTVFSSFDFFGVGGKKESWRFEMTRNTSLTVGEEESD